MRILILGGTKFLGRHLVDTALARGHVVTLFNRGQTNADLFPDVEKLHGDRDGGLDALRNRHWDAVIDPSGYVPRIVRQSVELLQDSVDHYIFVSSISVYADFSQVGMDEDAPVGKLADETSEDVPQFGGDIVSGPMPRETLDRLFLFGNRISTNNVLWRGSRTRDKSERISASDRVRGGECAQGPYSDGSNGNA